MNELNIVVLVSGGGSNLQAIIDAIKDGTLKNVKITNVISSTQDAYALQRAQENDIPTNIFSSREYKDIRDRMKALKSHLDGEHPDLIVLAGYLSILPKEIVEQYRGQIINIHPALLPKYGGKDHYGIKVHQRVIEAGEKESGATVHYVDEGVDTGKILVQERVPVLPDDTPETLAARVLEVEHKILPKAIGMIEQGRY